LGSNNAALGLLLGTNSSDSQMDSRAGHAPPVFFIILRCCYVGCLHPLLAFDDLKGNPLALFECPEPLLVDGRMVHEYILAVVSSDETIPFFPVKPLYCSLCHVQYLSCILPLPCMAGDTADEFLKSEDIVDEMLTWGSRTEGVLRRSKLKSDIFFIQM